MKLLSPLPHSKKARIEIIPLIDIMFFLLACMMMISLNMVNLKGMKVNLPTAQTATPENKNDFYTLSVNKTGDTFLNKEPLARDAIVDRLKRLKAEKPELRVYIQADMDTINGDVMAVLDRVRAAGIQKVAFQTKADEGAPARRGQP